MPFKIREIITVQVDANDHDHSNHMDDSASVTTYDPDETTMETSMVLLGSPIPGRYETNEEGKDENVNDLDLNQNLYQNQNQQDDSNRNIMGEMEQNISINLPVESFVDPDETMMSMSPSHQSHPLHSMGIQVPVSGSGSGSGPVGEPAEKEQYYSKQQSPSHSLRANKKGILNIFSQESSIAGTPVNTTTPVKTKNITNTLTSRDQKSNSLDQYDRHAPSQSPSQSQSSSQSQSPSSTRQEHNVSIPVTTNNESKMNMGSNEKIYKESYESYISSIIAENKKYVHLPVGDISRSSSTCTNSVDERIQRLYRYMENEGVFGFVHTLGITSKQQGGSNRKSVYQNVVDKPSVSTRTAPGELERERSIVTKTIDGNDENVLATQERSYSQYLEEEKDCSLDERNTSTLTDIRCISNQQKGLDEDGNGDGCTAQHSEETVGTSNLSKDHSFNLSNIYDTTNHHHSIIGKFRETENFDKSQSARTGRNPRSSISSIELPRNDPKVDKRESISFQSPVSTYSKNHHNKASRKRIATSSGKKGEDLLRMRLEDETSFHPIYENFSQQVNEIMDSPTTRGFVDNDGPGGQTTRDIDNMDKSTQLRSNEKGDISFLDSALFSQSPIPHRNSILTPQEESTGSSPLENDDDSIDRYLQKQKEKQTRIHNQKHKQKEQHDSPPFEQNHGDDSSCSYNTRKPSNREQSGAAYFSDISTLSLSGARNSTSPQRRERGSHCTKSYQDSRAQGYHSSSPTRSEDMMSDHLESPHRSFANDNDNDSIESVDSDILREQARKKKYNEDESIIDDEYEEGARRNISLKDTSRLHYNPLQVYRPPRWAKIYQDRKKNTSKTKERSKRLPVEMPNTQESIDRCRPKALPTMTYIHNPFKEFGSRDAERLEVASEWLNGQDSIETNLISENAKSGKAIILSTTNRQILSLSLQVLLTNGVHIISRHDRHLESNSMDRSSNSNSIFGGTLIVARSKEELVEWECGLREKTGFTVLNHAELTSTERRRITMMTKASGFDVVLTTYDALKAKEISIAVDDMGRVLDRHDSQGGWLKSRMTCSDEEQYKSRTLSQLHNLQWSRMIMIDSLGRQGYLTKPGTARAQAVATIKVMSR